MLDNIMFHLRTPNDQSRQQRAHFVGIHGSGMRALATIMLARGWQLTGSDLQQSNSTALTASGVRISVGHASGNVPSEATLLVYSDAVAVDNPERREAQRRG